MQSALKASLQASLDGHMFSENRISIVGSGGRLMIDEDDLIAVEIGEDMKYVDTEIGEDIDYLRALRMFCPLCL